MNATISATKARGSARSAEGAHERQRSKQHRDDQRAHADRIDVVEMRALELDVLRAEPSGLLITRSAVSAPIHPAAKLA
jgi:hypothetical protein